MVKIPRDNRDNGILHGAIIYIYIYILHVLVFIVCGFAFSMLQHFQILIIDMKTKSTLKKLSLPLELKIQIIKKMLKWKKKNTFDF